MGDWKSEGILAHHYGSTILIAYDFDVREKANIPTDLDRLIRGVGQSTFVRFFDHFSDQSLSHADVVALLPEGYTLKSRHSRTTPARRIFREGLEREALELIYHSERVDDSTRQGAREILLKLS